jgi:hypothetical protein
MGIPLVALMGRPPQIEPYQDQVARAQQIQSLRNQNALAPGQLQLQQGAIQGQALELQRQQQALHDQQALTQAMQEWDGKDYSSLPGLVLKHGGSATSVLGLKSSFLNQQKQLLELDEGQRKIEEVKNDHFAQAIDNVLALPADQQPQAFQSAVADSVQKGYLNPQQAQGLQYQGPEQLEALRKFTLGHKAALAQSAEQAKAAEESTASQKNVAEAGKAETESAINQEMLKSMQGGGLNPKIPIEQQEAATYLKTHPGKTLNDYQVWKAQHSPSVIVQGLGGGGAGGVDPMVDMVGQGRVDLSTVLSRMAPIAKDAFLRQLNAKYPEFSQLGYGMNKYMTTGEGGKNLTAFNTAIEHANQLSQAVDALGNGDVRTLNKVGNALGYEFGSDRTTNFNVIKSALSGEISKVFKGGQATDAEIKEVSAPFNSANSPAQLKGAINNAIRLMNSKRDALREQFEQGQQGKPNFGNNANTSGLIYARDPQGKLHSAPAGTSLPAGWTKENR